MALDGLRAPGDDSDGRSAITPCSGKFIPSCYSERVRVQATTPNTGALDSSNSEIGTTNDPGGHGKIKAGRIKDGKKMDGCLFCGKV